MEQGIVIESWPGRVDAEGRVLIPQNSRQRMGWKRGTELVIESDGDSLRILSLDKFAKELPSVDHGNQDRNAPMEK